MTIVETFIFIVILILLAITADKLYREKMIFAASILILATFLGGVGLSNELKTHFEQRTIESRIEQKITVESFVILQNGVKIPIDTVITEIKIPSKQINY